MAVLIHDFISDFNKIESEADLAEFVKKHELIVHTPPDLPRVLGLFSGEIEDREVKIRHRWYDRSSPFDTLAPDGNDVLLEVRGLPDVSVKFDDSY